MSRLVFGILFAVFACVIYVPAAPAQGVPVGAPAASVTPPPKAAAAPVRQQIAPDFSEAGTGGSVDDTDEIQRTPEAEAETQKIQQEWRDAELRQGGFKWMPWNAAGDKVHQFVFAQDKFAKKFYVKDGRYADVAIADVDGDSEPDVVLYDWSSCVASGCFYKIYFSNKNRNPAAFTVRTLRPYQDGVMADEGYYGY